MILKGCIVILLLSICNYLQANMWIDGKAEGWAWYEKKEEKALKHDETKEICPSIQTPNYTERLSKIQEQLNEAKAKAVLEPTQENVYTYQVMQKMWSENASAFTKTWVLNLLEHPEIDSRIANPVTQYGINAQKETDSKEKKALCMDLAKSHVLFFFYRGGEKASQIFSVILTDFAKTYGFKLVGILADDIPIEGIRTLPDNGLIDGFAVSVFPSAYLVHMDTGNRMPISHGLSSFDQIENNVWLQLSQNLRVKENE